MAKKREIALLSIGFITSLPLWGGTGRPSDGMLSFLLLLGFLLLLLGVLQLIDHVKRWIENLLHGMY
jgi:hypothetical protein